MPRLKSSPKKRPKPKYTLFHLRGREYKVPKNTFKEIRKLQLTTENCIPKLPFSRFVREVIQAVQGEQSNLRIQSSALKALQEATEIYATILFEDANTCAAHAKRITVRPDDMLVTLELRGPSDVFNH